MVWESTQGQNMRPNRLSHIYSMNTVLFVNATIHLPTHYQNVEHHVIKIASYHGAFTICSNSHLNMDFIYYASTYLVIITPLYSSTMCLIF